MSFNNRNKNYSAWDINQNGQNFHRNAACNPPASNNNNNLVNRRCSYYEGNNNQQGNRPRNVNEYRNNRTASIPSKHMKPSDFTEAARAQLRNNYYNNNNNINKGPSNNQANVNKQNRVSNNFQVDQNKNEHNQNFNRQSLAQNASHMNGTYSVSKVNDNTKLMPTLNSLSLVKVEPIGQAKPQSSMASSLKRPNDDEDGQVDENNNAAKKFHQTELSSLEEIQETIPASKCDKSAQSDSEPSQLVNKDQIIQIGREICNEFAHEFTRKFAKEFAKDYAVQVVQLFVQKCLEVGREHRTSNEDLTNGLTKVLDGTASERTYSLATKTPIKQNTTTIKGNGPTIAPDSESTRINMSNFVTDIMNPESTSSPVSPNDTHENPLRIDLSQNGSSNKTNA